MWRRPGEVEHGLSFNGHYPGRIYRHGSSTAMGRDRIRCRKSLERAPMASSAALVLRMLIMLFKMQPYESCQDTVEVRHRQCTCQDRLRGQQHLTTKPRGSSVSLVEAPMPRNAELVTKPCGERGYRGQKRAGLSSEQMRILPPLRLPSVRPRASLVIGDNPHVHRHQIS
jgi:hypothetical protein